MEAAIRLVDSRQDVEALYRADAGRLWRAVYAFAADPDIASDAVAEAYAQLLHRGDAVHDAAAWTWRTAFRIAAGSLKRRRSEAQASADELGTMSIAGRADSYGDPDLLRALRRLPDGQRAAVILFYFADLPIRQIADRIGSNSLAVRANLSRGRKRLRELLGDDDA
jgi:RNA polymerase sigma-70 factor (ECF subfamily)